ncbi:MAG: type IV pilus twitching motility protein PilT [Deltaproteobacteria bacterium]|nr:type IV pilus twitching motility protein PilT [Deltaproteobacteria bacterium]
MMTLAQLLRAMLDNKASDLHLTTGSPPTFRVHGRILRAKTVALGPSDTKELCYSVLTDVQKARFEEDKQLDFSFGVRDLARFRGNVFYQRGAVAGAFRHIPFQVPKLSSLGLPPVLQTLLTRPRGLVLITGSTGSGKSTTLAAMVDALNDTESFHVLTIEDPIEYIHQHRSCLVNQREVGQDAKEFSGALKAALREDPDVVMLGEMRDQETIETALTLAETGHLVLSTLHTNSAYQTISRIVQVFPSEQQDQIRMQLSLVLEGIVTQSLLERADVKGRIVAVEVLIPNASIRNLIRENKLFQIPSAMLVGQEQTGMITMNQSLMLLAKKRMILPETAIENSPDPEELIKQITDYRKKVAAGG